MLMDTGRELLGSYIVHNFLVDAERILVARWLLPNSLHNWPSSWRIFRLLQRSIWQSGRPSTHCPIHLDATELLQFVQVRYGGGSNALDNPVAVQLYLLKA